MSVLLGLKLLQWTGMIVIRGQKESVAKELGEPTRI